MRFQAAAGARRLAACLILVPALGLTQVPGVTVDNNPSAFPWQTGQLLVSWQAPSFTASTFTITAAPLNATFTFPSAAAMATMGWVTVRAGSAAYVPARARQRPPQRTLVIPPLLHAADHRSGIEHDHAAA